MLWWLPCVVASVKDVSFANFGNGYLQVIAEGLSCTKTSRYRFQRSVDSAKVPGTARESTTGTYGIFDTAEQIVTESGMFVPEFDTGANAGASITKMWSDWIETGQTDNVFAYKYAPTGKLIARDTGSIDANIALSNFLEKLPGLTNAPYNYSNFESHVKEPWKRQRGHNAFPGMLPGIHPVLDKDTTKEHQQYAVRPCPGGNADQCCLVVENGILDEAVNPTGIDTKGHITLDNGGITSDEFGVRWIQKAFHTSFSRGLADIFTYRENTARDDLARLYETEEYTGLIDLITSSLATVKTTTGSAEDPSNNQNELKCRLAPDTFTASYYAAARLEHFYSAVVGVEEAGMLRQKPPEYDGDHNTDFFLHTNNDYDGGDDNVDFDSADDTKKDFLQTSFDFRDHNCAAQVGGHCGFGYLCKEQENFNSCLMGDTSDNTLAGLSGDYGKKCAYAAGKGKCIPGRWRGRPELLRFAGDGVDPAIPQSNYTRLAHVLDGERQDWYNEEFRMSARLVYTGPHEDNFNQQGSHELPCSTTRMDGLYKNIGGDFTRACGKMRTTQYEWLLGAFLQTQLYPDDTLHRSGLSDDGFDWETDRGIGPRPCSLDPVKCYVNNKHDRVRMWDIDSTWSLNINKNNYQGVDPDSEYAKNLEKVLKVDGVTPEFLHYTEDYQPPSSTKLTQHGSSDGTSRTNVHAASCYLSTPIDVANADGDTGSKFSPYWDSNTNYYAARPSFWPYTWGTLRAVNADVDWTAPSGCDLTYGPPCNYNDAVAGKFHNPSKAEYDYNGINHQQGGPGVFGCTAYSGKRYRGNYNAQRSLGNDWDHNVHPTGAHSCTNLNNVTHFSLDDLKVEEWDMRAAVRHDYYLRNCGYDDGVAIHCNIAGVSLNCHNPVSPIDNGHNTYVYKEGDSLKAKFFVGPFRANALASGGDTSPRSPDYKEANDGAVWVNWGTREQTNNAPNGPTGDYLSKQHTVYRHGKDDGVVECFRTRDDLLLHSLLKRTWSCEGSALKEELKQLSPCANPKDYHEWRNNIVSGTENDFFSFSNSIEELASGREYKVTGTVDFTCLCGDEESCNCNLLARTSRLVVGKEDSNTYYDGENKPYSPQWVRDGQAETPWCMRQRDQSNDPGFVPNRACPKDILLGTPMWDGRVFEKDQYVSDNNNPVEYSVARSPFVQRKNSVFTRAELDQMRACVNIDGNDFCQGDVARLGGTPTITLLDNEKTSVVIGTTETCSAHFEEKNQQLGLDGLRFSPVRIDENNHIQEAQDNPGDNLCRVSVDNTFEGTKPYKSWKIDYEVETFTFPKNVVASKMGIYELRKLQQCLEGSTSCPKIVYDKTLRFTFPVSTCPLGATPRIMYRCFEDNDLEGVVFEDTAVLTPLRQAENNKVAKDYGVRGFEHVMSGTCIDKIQFAVECNEEQELHELDTDICKSYEFNENCRPNVNNHPLRAAMCVKPLDFNANIGMPQFNMTAPKGQKLSTTLPDPIDCRCNANNEKYGRIIAKQKNSALCYEQFIDDRLVQLFADADTPETDADFDVSVCSPTFREVDLSDYRDSIPMHVYWRHCSALQFHFKDRIETTYSNAYIAVSDEISSTSQRKFYARLSIPLSFEKREASDGGSIMWAYDSTDGETRIRELVPGLCRGMSTVKTDSGTSSSIFTRQIGFDFAPGEPFSEIAYGQCPDGEDICTGRKTPVFYNNLLPHSFTLGITPMSTHIVSSNECAVQCQITERCKTFAHTGSRCLLFDAIPRLALLKVEDTGDKYSARPVFGENGPIVGDGVVGFGTCFDPLPLSFNQLRPPVPPPPRCSSGKTLVPIDLSADGTNRQYTCVQSACDRDRQVAIALGAPARCSADCQNLCGGAHEELSRYTVNTPALWTIEEQSNNADYDYADELPLSLTQTPRFEFILPQRGSTFESALPRRVVQLKFTLPPVKLKFCDPCYNPTTNTTAINCHNRQNNNNGEQNQNEPFTPTVANVHYKLYAEDETTEPLFEDTQFQFEVISGQGPGHQGTQEITVGLNNPIDAEIHAFLRLVVTVELKTGAYADYNLQYNIRGDHCLCDQHNPTRTRSNYSSNSVDFDTNTETNCVDFSSVLPVLPKANAFPSATLLLCEKMAEPPEVCVERTHCNTQSEFTVDDGSLERDRKCTRHPVCLDGEYEKVVGTPSTLRECARLVECSTFQETTRVGDRKNQFECSALGRCNAADQYRNTDSKLCETKTVCSNDGLMQIKDVSDFANAECTEYKVICNAVQYEESDQTSTSEAECESYTICEEQEFSLREASVSTDRVCKPLLTCKPREIYEGPGNFVTDAVCTAVVRFSSAWVIAAAIVAGYLGCALIFVIEDKLPIGSALAHRD